MLLQSVYSELCTLTNNECNGTPEWLPSLLPLRVVCPILLVLVFYQLHAPCPRGSGSVGRVSDSGSMDSGHNISQCPFYNHTGFSVSWLHSLNTDKKKTQIKVRIQEVKQSCLKIIKPILYQITTLKRSNLTGNNQETSFCSLIFL